jgi:CcmD family protein
MGLFIMQQVEMADALRANGKIFVVVAVMSCSLIGVIAYLVSLDRKINRLEKEIKS